MALRVLLPVVALLLVVHQDVVRAQTPDCQTLGRGEDHTTYERAVEAVIAAGTLAVVVLGRGGRVVQLLAGSGLTTSSFALGKSFFAEAEAKGTTVCVLNSPSGLTGTGQRQVFFGPPGETERLAAQVLRTPALVPDWTQSALNQGHPVDFKFGSNSSLQFLQPSSQVRSYGDLLKSLPAQ